MCFSTFNYLASVQNVLVILKCGCGVCFIKLIENILAKAVANLSMSNSVTKQLSCKAYFETKQRYFSHQSKIHDKIAVISVKIFCQPKYFLVTRKPRYTIISKTSPNLFLHALFCQHMKVEQFEALRNLHLKAISISEINSRRYSKVKSRNISIS